MFPFSYEITDTEVRVKIRKAIVRRISIEDIESVREGSTFINEHWTNFWPMRFVTIRRKTGLFKNFLINPKNRSEFISYLNRKLEKTVTNAR